MISRHSTPMTRRRNTSSMGSMTVRTALLTGNWHPHMMQADRSNAGPFQALTDEFIISFFDADAGTDSLIEGVFALTDFRYVVSHVDEGL